jgi:hypothetical protein
MLAGLLTPAASSPGVTFSISPSAVSNTYTGSIALQIGGLATGATVEVSKYLDANTNGTVDAADWLVQSFRLKDGQASVIGGVTNINVPRDSNPTNGAITSLMGIQSVGVAQDLVARFLFRISSPTGGFAALTNAFEVTPAAYAQKFSGKVQCGGTNVPYAGVLVFGPDGGPIAGTVTDGSGAYTSKVPAGAYQLGAFKSGYVYNLGAAPVFTLGEGGSINTNLNLLTTTRTVSGSLVNATNASIGVPGILVGAQSADGLLVIGFTATNGSFVLPVTAGEWQGFLDDQQPPLDSYFTVEQDAVCDTTSGDVSGVSIALIQGRALFYGAVRDGAGQPMPGLSMYASDWTHESDGATDSYGSYAIAVTGGGWRVEVETAGTAYGNYLFPEIDAVITNGQAVRIDFTGKVAAIISGQLLGEGNPIENGHVEVGVVTFSGDDEWSWQHVAGENANEDGSYGLLVPPGTNYIVRGSGPLGWLEQYYNNVRDVRDATPVAALTNAAATNVNFNLQQGAQLSGRVTGAGSPLSDAFVQAGVVTFLGGGSWDWQFVEGIGTDTNGDYVLWVPQGTNYTVRANGPDGIPWIEQYYSNATDVSHATSVKALTNQSAAGIDFDLTLGMGIEGSVMDATNQPLNVGIEFMRWNGTSWDSIMWGTRGDGTYACYLPAGSNYIVHVNDLGYHEVYFSNKLSEASADVISAPAGVIVSNVNFRLFDPSADSDHDGFPDYLEGYVAGTDPFNSNDLLRCVGLQSSNRLVTLTWASVSGKSYRVARATNLMSAAAWTNLTASPVQSVGSKASCTDSNAPPGAQYRVLINY